MNRLLGLIDNFKDYANYIALGMCIVGIILAIIMICIMALAGTKKSQKLIPKNLGIAERNIHDLKTAFDLMYVEKIPFISGWMADILQEFNIIKTGPIISSFFKIMRIIKRSTFEKDWEYFLPWYLVIGPKSSGKSQLLDGLQFMNLPGEEKTHEDTWRLFDNSILFEVPSNTFFTEATTFWIFLCKLFRYFRPRRPLDGIVLTISADALIENSAELVNIARETAYKISSAQNLINMKLPIYIIITNADKIKCFSDFCSELSVAEKNQIIGWSAENDYEKVLPNNWLELFKNSVHIGLRKAALSFASKKKISETLNKAIFAPMGIEQIMEGLESYITSLTKSKDKSLSPFIRGIYFSAISKDKISAVPIVQANVLNPNNENLRVLPTNNMIRNGVCFVEDLFRDKILAERNLAEPININKLQADRNIWIKRGAYITFSVVWVVGWHYGRQTISKEIRSAETTLRSALSLMKKINVIENEIRDKTDQQIMNNEIRRMLQLLSSIKRQNMFSAFIPASWFSGIPNKIASTIGIIFDSTATKAIFLDLNLNAKSIGKDTLESIASSKFISSKKDPFEIASLESFVTLKNYIERIQKLEKLEGEYNRLRKLEDPEAFNAITKEIFKETFNVVNLLNERESSSKFVAPQFNLDEFRSQIYTNLKELFRRFLSEIFDQTIEKIFEKLCEDINFFAMSTQNPKEIYSAENLSKLNAKILKIIEIITSKKFAWIGDDTFNPNFEYSNLLSNIEGSNILGYKISKELRENANDEFSKLKNLLSGYSTAFTGKLLNSSLNGPSEGLSAFSKELNTIVKSSFTIKVQEKALITQIPSDQTLNWDIPVIKEAINLIDRVENFERNALRSFRQDFQPVYSDVIRKMIYKPVVNIIARAQVLEDAPNSMSTSNIESLMKKHAYNLKSLSQHLSKIIGFLDGQESKGGDSCGFQNLIIEQATDLLKTADSLFELETPYSVSNDLFSDWSGNLPPTFGGSNDPNLVKKYLSAQYSRVKFLAKEIAWPAISVLSLEILSDRIAYSSEIHKWADISEQIDEFESSKPGNSIASLEAFITSLVSGASMNAIRNDPAIAEISNQTGDYFTNQKSKIAKALLNRATNINLQKAYDLYNSLANFFNENMAGKAPFGPSFEDVSLQTIENFISMYESFDMNVINVLRQNAMKQNIPEEVLSFIGRIPAIINFLKLWLEHSKTTDQSNAFVGFKFDTRVNKENETYGNIILDRSVFVNGFNTDDSGNIAIFHNGDTVEVELPFISSGGIEILPSNDNSLQINGKNVKFVYSGAWGIFGLIQNHKMAKSNALSANGTVLEFAVPISNQDGANSEAKVYMKVTPLMRTSSGNWQAISIPEFPTSAPVLQTNI